MSFFTKFSLKNPMAIIILCTLLAGLGIFSFATLKTDLLPDIQFPELSITIVYPGASAVDVDEKVTQVAEAELANLADLQSMRSQSYESISRIQLSFPIGTDMEKLENDVKQRLNQTSLPTEVDVKVDRFTFGALPIVQIALFEQEYANIDHFELWVEEELKAELLKINGVNSVAIGGLEEEYLLIEIDKEKANNLGISLNQMKEEIQNASFSFPVGSLEENGILVPVRIQQTLNTMAALQGIQVKSHLTGEKVLLKDIATIQIITELSEYTRYNQKPALSLMVNKKQDANTVEVADKIYEILQENAAIADYAVAFDQAEGIKSSIKELISKGLFGALFASLAVLIFLRNVRATMIAILSIPLSLLIAAIFVKWWGITLNVMSLAGMAVAVGRVVDDSIIVIENIYRKMRLSPKGERNELTIQGTKEMMNPIISSTLTSIVVFLPLALVGGITGEFFMPFAFTIIVALLASLVVAITIVPILAKLSFIKIKEHTHESWYIRLYERIIKWSLGKTLNKVIICIIAIALLIPSFILSTQLGFVFLPNEKQKVIMANLELPPSTVLDETNRASQLLEEVLAEQPDQISQFFTAVGAYDFMTGTSLSNRVTYYIELTAEADIDQTVNLLQKAFEGEIENEFGDAIVNVQEFNGNGPPIGNNVAINLYSNNMSDLAIAAESVEELLLTRNDLRYVSNNFEDRQLQWVIDLNYDVLAEYGIQPFMILGIVNEQLRQVQLGRLTLDGDEMRALLAYDQAVQDMAELRDQLIYTNQGPVQLRELANISRQEVYKSIQKLDSRVYAQVTADVIGNDLFGVTAAVTEQLNELQLPASVSYEIGGGSDETMETLIDIVIAIAVAVGLVYITMLVFFGQARVPFIILTSILFVPIGSLIALWLAKEPLSMSAMIGFLMLVGIVVTNAIVLVDRVIQNRQSGMAINEALIEAGKTRIRPILMTALATIAALLPLAFSTPEGGLISRGLALVVIGGLTTSTLLTLVFLPVVYSFAYYRTLKAEQDRKANEGVTI